MRIMDYQVNQSGFSKYEQMHQITEIVREDVQANIDLRSDENAYQLDLQTVDLSGKPPIEDENLDKASFVKDGRIATLRLLEVMMSRLRGRGVKLDRSFLNIRLNSGNADINMDFEDSEPQLSNRMDSMNFEFSHSEIYEENEQVDFHSDGVVKTADGKTIDFRLDFSMQRQFTQEYQLNINTGERRIDPLVVAFGGTAPTLSQNKYEFDLNSDGQMERISMPTSGSGFLVYDKNGNGTIDNGSELFGPQNGDGFEALRVYDTDENGWIDDADDIFSKLSVMTTEGYNKTLFKLADVGIGAIYLNSVDTEFSMQSGIGEQGKMQSTSIFLRENGTAGTVHHVDLTL